MSAIPTLPPPIVYPESDGKPMPDNTKQFRWINRIYSNLAGLFRDHPDVFVSGNQNWYPEEGHPEIVNAPDVYVVFGRPKDDRGSYKQWEEDDGPMTVVFEILSPSNTEDEMKQKLYFYEHYGVEEYYIYDPQKNTLEIWVRKRSAFLRVRKVNKYVSPRLGIRFDLSGPEMVVYYPDGQPFLPFEELKAARENAEQRADDAEERADDAEQRLVRVLELSRKARQGQATADELAKLDCLEADASSLRKESNP